MSVKYFNSLVTGGAQGIGRAIVDTLQARGDTVFVFDYLKLVDERVQALTAQGVQYINIDVRSFEQIKHGFNELFLRLSSQVHTHLNLVVNNAGVTRDNLAIRLTEDQWDTALEINLKGAFFCAQQALIRMIKQPELSDRETRGYIINISSIVGQTGNPGQVNYAASKAGLIAVTKTLAQEYGKRGILVNAIAPGFIQTSMTEKLSDAIKQAALERTALKRLGRADDIAQAVAYLSSGNADYITGAVIDITGGMV
jgi:3-oxoacyl-[acyl-carrier protein] reductase